MIETLETRRLLHSFSVTADGFLAVRMLAGNDRVDLAQTSTDIVATIYENGVIEDTDNFTLAQVKSVLIYGSETANVINLGNLTLPVGVDAGKGSDSVIGGAGRDTLKGGPGNDTLIGNVGDDVIDGGTGRDNLTGGLGRDILDYSKRTENLTIILSDTANNGTTGENDIATTSFEIVRGGSGNDTLGTTSSRGVTLIGNAGNDTLTGGSGNDALDGGTGLDQMNGNDGNDTFYAQDGLIETLRGGAGNDTILTRDKKDKLFDIP